MATESRGLVVFALIANAIIAVVKSIAAGISGSSGMLDVDLDPGLAGNDVEAAIDRIEAASGEAVPDASRIFIEPGSLV